MSLEIKNLCINVKIETDEKTQTLAESIKVDILRECRQIFENYVIQNQER
jgi:hypothetical protein